MEQKEVLETISAAKTYLRCLTTINSKIENAEKQIILSYADTENAIIDIFSALQNNIMKILNNRQQKLLDKAKTIRDKGIAPLEECRSIVTSKINNTTKLLQVGENILSGHNENLNKFVNDASLLGSLPEVPDLREVPYISFKYETTVEDDLYNSCLSFGEIFSIAPVQIIQLLEKPGGILVEWNSLENDDRFTDIQEYRLQRAFGDVINEKHLLGNFTDCYTGIDNQFLVKDIQPNQLYSFRVCCKFEGNTDWSPWSLPQLAKTSIKPFSWNISDDYKITSENKIAKPTKSLPSLLRSDGPQFCVGYCVEFTFLEADISNAFVGLVKDTPQVNLLQTLKEGSFLLYRDGKTFVEGIEKSTILAEFTKGSKVTFTCELVNNDKVMVNIDSNNKRVTYEWPINPKTKMYFVAHFESCNWKIMVE